MSIIIRSILIGNVSYHVVTIMISLKGGFVITKWSFPYKNHAKNIIQVRTLPSHLWYKIEEKFVISLSNNVVTHGISTLKGRWREHHVRNNGPPI